MSVNGQNCNKLAKLSSNLFSLRTTNYGEETWLGAKTGAYLKWKLSEMLVTKDWR